MTEQPASWPPASAGPPPPSRRTRKGLWIALAIAGAVLLFGGCVAAVVVASSNIGTRVRSVATTHPAEPTTGFPTETSTAPEPTDDPASSGPKIWSVGETGVVTIDGEDAGEVTVSKVEAFQTANSFGQVVKPDNRWFLKVTIKAKGLAASGFEINPFDFYVRMADGSRYDYGEGNSLGVEGDQTIDGTTLNKGEKLTGALAFDTPSRHGRVVYAPGDQALGEWKF